VTDRDRAGRTPLHYAVIDAPVDLDHGAALKDPALKAENHRKIVDFILDNSRRLIDAGADVNASDETGSTPLHFAAKGESEEVVELLVDAGANVNAANSKGETPLNNAVSNTTSAQLPIIRLLRARGADPTIPAQDGFTALKYVQRYGKPELRELFADLL
jgi:ankyrin repeat protein